MIFPFGDTITLYTRTKSGVDAYGDDVYTDVPSTVVGAFAPGASSELVQGQDTVINQPTVYLPEGTDVASIDYLIVRGLKFEVDGSPNDWRNPFTGWAPGIEVRLQGVTG